jgi:hypothetical protein
MVDPASDCFVWDRYAPFCQQIFDVSETEGEPQIEPDRLVNDLRRETVPALRISGSDEATERSDPRQDHLGVTKPRKPLLPTFSAISAAGRRLTHEPSALAVMAFALTWACLGLIQLIGVAPATGVKR